MGIDISIGSDIELQGNIQAYLAKKQANRLSRDFCQLLSRRYLYPGKSEIEQLAQITRLNFQAWYDMEHYPSEVWLQEELLEAENEASKQKILAKATQAKIDLQHNLPKALSLTQVLIQKVEKEPDLITEIIAPNPEDQQWVVHYFSPFGFQKDLQHIIRFLQFLQTEGATTVYWQLG